MLQLPCIQTTVPLDTCLQDMAWIPKPPYTPCPKRAQSTYETLQAESREPTLCPPALRRNSMRSSTSILPQSVTRGDSGPEACARPAPEMASSPIGGCRTLVQFSKQQQQQQQQQQQLEMTRTVAPGVVEGVRSSVGRCHFTRQTNIPHQLLTC